MIEVDVEEAQAHLKEYLAKVKPGEKVVLCDDAKDKFELRVVSSENRASPIPVEESPQEFLARVRAEAEKSGELNQPRVLGSGVGQGTIHPSFYDPMTAEELALWYGDETKDESF